jgi:hypothetical protein
MSVFKRLISFVPKEQKRRIKKSIYTLSPFCFDFALDGDINSLKRKINRYFRIFFLQKRKFINEIDFLNGRSSVENLFSIVIPSPFVFDYDHNLIAVFRDEGKDLFYVIHKGKRLYYSRFFQSESDVRLSYNGLCIEQDERSPHRYLTDDFNVLQHDVVVDIGAAEGNFSLEVVEKADVLYIFEPDEKWVEALNATFEPWKEKVHIINKYVSDADSADCITLESFFGDNPVDFIKIDAEGADKLVLKGAGNKLSANKSLKIAVCTYHRKHDSRVTAKILREYGFNYSFSGGYILFIHSRLTPPFFRRGLIRAKK